jgi:hypothetical protein
MGTRLFTPALIAAVCLAVGCDEPTPTEVTPEPSDLQFSVTSNEKDVPFAFGAAGCGDQIWIEGTDHWVVKRTETPSGRIQWSWRTNFSGSAIGTLSGNRWKVTGTYGYQEVLDGNDGFPYVAKYQDWAVFVGLGQTPNVKWKANFHVTINASGDVVVERRPFDVTCQGY